ncbi:hypothetical protein L861_06865 [Litchfieldella anticariensis FP35 = DSM 16096]|uniref:NADH:quinone oxidoreductase/Mrp antiporter transmembrane domain-containing protein n=1 Tax=Litchfieldella anticariensis (strain DSM 16096 / CECT 5854 / CIP 108499 / LMG 22089 / FP35) TaxID=1121939 RepID=S2KIL4_LITA3|nr:proton-conducting transporter membrane subunit [Halomonas anticariensis]EPC00208.1 hypothetical protein L861_06865 [Halomonas anticariensis FP35 = DSM 16096]
MLWSVPLLPLLCALLVYVYGRWCRRAVLILSAVGGVIVALVLAAVAIMNDWGGSYRWSEALVLTLKLSTPGMLFTLAVPLIALPIVVYSGYHELPRNTGREGVGGNGARLVALIVAFIGAMQLLVLAGDLLTLLIAWELVGACSWALISHHWGERDIPRDAATAFLVTRLGDLGLYIAAAAVFAGTGSFGYTALGVLDGGLLQVAAAGIILAAAAKSAQIPFSFWLFAAMSGPVSVSALLHAATMVAAGIYLLARLQPELAAVVWFMPLTVTIGLATALAGGVVATFQGHAKKLLAASTSAQYGLMWVAIGAGFPGVALLHFIAHACLKAGMFLSAGLAERHAGSYRLADMRLGRRMPRVAVITLVSSLALAGIFPLGAAWSKEQVVSAASHQSLWLALLVAVAGCLSALYATRFQLLAYGWHERDGLLGSRISSVPELGALAALTLATLGLSLWWSPSAHQAVIEPLGLSLPSGHLWLLALSLGLAVLGIVAGASMVRGERSTIPHGWQVHAGEWFGLPKLAQGAAATTLTFGMSLARFDDHVVDAGLRGTARCARWLARWNASRAEWLAEGVPGGLSRLTKWGGQWARQAQSGQMHHYYSGIVVGFGLIVVILLLGAYL